MIGFIQRVFFLLLFTGIIYTANADVLPEKTVRGRITDLYSGRPVVGITVLRHGTITGTVSDTNGEYSITVAEGQRLIFSGNGYKNREVVIGGARKYHVFLEPLTNIMDGPVVAGFGVSPSENSVFSAQYIDDFRFNNGFKVTPQQLIQGKVAGMTIISKGGSAGGDFEMALQGRNSLLAGNNPLFVVDGLPLGFGGVSGIRNPLSIVHPDDIESFTVWKGGAASMYGWRGSNGVVLINTRMADRNQPLKVRFSSRVSVAERSKTWNLAAADEFRALVNEKFAADGSHLLGQSNTDWQKEVFRQSVSTDNNLSLTGVQGGVPFRVSYGFTRENGIVLTDHFSRITMSLGIQPTMLDGRIRMRMNMKAMLNNNRFGSVSALPFAGRFDPTQPVIAENWHNYFTWMGPGGVPNPLAPVNPVALLQMSEDFSRIVSSIGNISLTYRPASIPALQAGLNIGYDATAGAGELLQPENFPGRIDLQNGGGTFREYDQTVNNKITELFVKYEITPDNRASRLLLTGGLSRHHFSSKGSDRDANFSDSVLHFYLEHFDKRNLVSLFASAEYAISDKWVMTAVVRQDGLSGREFKSRWGTFPVLGAAWFLHNESVFRNSAVIDRLVFRLNYGISGNPATVSADPFLPGYAAFPVSGPAAFRDRWHWLHNHPVDDAEVKWETTANFHAGIEFGLSDNRISGSLDVNRRITENLNYYNPLLQTITPGSPEIFNAGSLSNTGVTLVLNTSLVKTRSLVWDMGINASWNRNRIEELSIPGDQDAGWILAGESAGFGFPYLQVHAKGHPVGTFYLKKQLYDSQNRPLEAMYDSNPAGQLSSSDSRYALHSPDPDYILGLHTQFKWHNLDAGASFRSHIGQHVYNSIRSVSGWRTIYHPSGFLMNSDREVLLSRFEYPQPLSDYFLSDASFLKIDWISLGYSFYKFLRNVDRVRIFTTLQNVAVITGYNGTDPEQIRGMEQYRYPVPANLVFGINIDF